MPAPPSAPPGSSAQRSPSVEKPRIHVFGLTGGLASGKSTAAKRLRALGVPVIDADALAREVVAPGTPGLAEVVRHFGEEVLCDGALDRGRLASIVFSHPEQRDALERITHPRIQRLRDERLHELEVRGEPLAVYEVPLLFEKGLEDGLRPIVVVSVPEAVQVARAVARDRSDEAQVRARLAAQLPLAEKARRADYVIDNTKTPDATAAAVDETLKQICAQLDIDPARYFGVSPQPTSGGSGSERAG